MKKKIALMILSLMVFASSTFAAAPKENYFLDNLQVGGWFGPITPVGSTLDVVKTNLGGGLFIREVLPFANQWFKVGFDSSYQHYKSEGVNELFIIPFDASFLFQIPIDIPVRFQIMGGFGGAYVSIRPEKKSQCDFVFSTGLEMSFPAGEMFNIGLLVKYYFLMESPINGVKRNGHVINAGITMYLNIGEL